MVKIQKYNQNTVIGVPLCIFRKSHCSIVYKQWKTIENNRKQWEQYIFEILFAQRKSTIILSILTKFGVIITNTAHFMDDFIVFEIYSKYIGFTRFRSGALH